MENYLKEYDERLDGGGGQENHCQNSGDCAVGHRGAEAGQAVAGALVDGTYGWKLAHTPTNTPTFIHPHQNRPMNYICFRLRYLWTTVYVLEITQYVQIFAKLQVHLLTQPHRILSTYDFTLKVVRLES